MPFSRIALRAFSILVLPILISGCGAFGGEEKPPAPPPPTLVEMEINAATNVNPGGDGAGSPLLVRIYELNGPVNFNNADFFALYEKDDATLGADMIRKREFIMPPGTHRSIHFKAEDDTQFMGVFAAFRKLETAKWRAVMPIQPNFTTAVSVKLEGTQLDLESVRKPGPVSGKSD